MKELLEKRARVFEQARALVVKAETEKRALTPEEQTEYDSRMAEVNTLGETINRSRQSAEMEAEMSRSIGPREDRGAVTPQGSDLADAAMGQFLRAGRGGMTQEQRSIYAPVPNYGDSIQLRAASPLSAVTNTAGQYTIPQGFVNNLEDALKWFGGMRQSKASVIRTATGNALPWPSANDTGNVGELIAENTVVTQAVTEMSFGVVSFGAYKFSSKLVLVPIELLQDSAFDISSFVAKKLGERLGRIQNTKFTVGTGSSEPKGIVAAATSGLTGAAPTALTYDELVTLEHSVDPAYRIGAEWMFNDSTAAYLEKLKDNNGRPLLNESFASIAANIKAGDVNAPLRYTLKGYPVVLNGDMDSIAATKKPVLFGDFSKYVIRDVMDLMLVRFAEKYMDYGQIGFLAFMRADGNLVDAGTNPVKFITQHA